MSLRHQGRDRSDGAAQRRTTASSREIVYIGPVPAPVHKGQPIGNLKVWRNDTLVLEVPLQAAEDVERGNLSQRAFDAATELVINLFRAGAERL